ncbi:MAG: RNA ligase family protein [Acidiferrobacterales bacterium]
MGYLHIENLYKNQDVLLFKECYAMEKVHGTSAHITFDKTAAELLHFFSGGEKHERFVKIFNTELLLLDFNRLGHDKVTVYGEAYGGSCQGMRGTYGDVLRFIAFDVMIGDSWLSVPDAAQVVASLGLEFVPYSKVSTDVAVLDGLRDAYSEVAQLRGCGNDKHREGIVLRPLIEVTKNNGSRIIAKHKGERFQERANQPRVIDVEKLAMLTNAKDIAVEWVTEMRLTHVLDKLGGDVGIERTGEVIKAMIEDVEREAKGEILESNDIRKAISQRAAGLFKERVKAQLAR